MTECPAKGKGRTLAHADGPPLSCALVQGGWGQFEKQHDKQQLWSGVRGKKVPIK